MLFTVVPTNGPGRDGQMAKCTVVGQFGNEWLVEENARDGFVSKVHSQCRSGSNGHDLVLSTVEM